jgi:myo-inositol catabolism protein IolC
MHFPLFILPFDHRSGFAKEIFGKKYPLKGKDAAEARALKMLVWEAVQLSFNEASEAGTPGILVDEDLGEQVIKEAKAKNVVHVVSTEQSGTDSYEFLHGDDFGKALLEVKPTYAKALVHYNAGDEAVNEPQREKLKRLSDFCKENQIPLMLEVLTKATPEDPSPVITSIRELLTHHIRPAIWKLEGFTDVESWNKLAEATTIPIIMLGRGESASAVETWTKAAAQSGAVSGFAIGRTIFLDALKKYHNEECSREDAVKEIAKNYLHFIDVWKRNAAV